MRFAVIAILLAACSSPSKPPPTPVEQAPVEPVADASALEQSPPAIDGGAAPAEPPALIADGGSCLSATECASGVCEGLGCTDDKPGTCAPAQRGCTRDLRAYCGCDGKTFKTSGSCPKRRYAAKDACPTGTKRPTGAF